MKIIAYLFGILSMLIIASCDKIDLDCETIETAESLPIPDGTRIEIEGSEYFKYTLPSTICKIIITDGNGTIHVEKGRETQISIPGYWVKENGYNPFEITEETITIHNTFSHSYLTLFEVCGVEIIDGNSTTYLAKDFATGTVNYDIGGNSTLTFTEVTYEIEPIDALDFHVNLNVYRNGTYTGYGVNAGRVSAVLHSNGNVFARVADALIVDIPSNGTAYYKGYPSITSTLSFQGELVDEN